MNRALNTTAIRARLNAASPGPWRGDRIDGTVKYDVLAADNSTVIHGCNGNENPAYGIYEPEGQCGSPNETFILHAPADVAALLDEVDRLLGEPPVHYCTTWEAPTRSTTTHTPESKLATVDQLLREWADEPAADLVSLLELVERIRRVVTS